MVLNDNSHKQNIDDEKPVVDKVDFIENVLPEVLYQEAVVRPNWQAEQVDNVNSNANHPFEAEERLLDDSIVDANKWDYAQVP